MSWSGYPLRVFLLALHHLQGKAALGAVCFGQCSHVLKWEKKMWILGNMEAKKYSVNPSISPEYTSENQRGIVTLGFAARLISVSPWSNSKFHLWKTFPKQKGQTKTKQHRTKQNKITKSRECVIFLLQLWGFLRLNITHRFKAGQIIRLFRVNICLRRGCQYIESEFSSEFRKSSKFLHYIIT